MNAETIRKQKEKLRPYFLMKKIRLIPQNPNV